MKKLIRITGTILFAAALMAVPWVAGSRTVRADDVAIDETNFPDESFRNYLLSQDYGSDGILTEAEIADVKEIDVRKQSISDLKGIEYFTELTELQCYDNQLTSLDVSKNADLEILDCSNTQLTSLDVSNHTKLKRLECSNNQLTKLDVSGCTALESLYCVNNQLTSLDVSESEDLLFNLERYGIKISEGSKYYISQGFSCDISTKLVPEYLIGPIADAVEINEKNFPDAIFRKYVSDNYDLDHDGVLKKVEMWDITEIYVNEKKITDLRGIEFFTRLKKIECEKNQLTSLDLSTCQALKELDCSDNKLTNVDVSRCVKLLRFDCSNNVLTELNVSSALDLLELDCKDNNIAVLDISSNKNLKDLVEKKGVEKVEEKYYLTLGTIPHDDWYSIELVLKYDISTQLILTPTESSTPTPTPTPTVAPLKPAKSSIGDFAERLYTVALNRESDADGKKYWVDEITNGNKTGGECAHFFLIDAPEFLNRKLSTEDFVETLYQTFFGRESEPAGKAYWVGELRKGTKTREDVISGFIDSTEWCNICASYGVKSGAPTAKAEKASENATDFATRLYTCCLNRDPEEKGLEYWALALTNLEQTGCSAAKFFFTGDEFVGLKLKNEEYVRRLYTTFMGRDPEDSEIAYWVGEIVKGTQTKKSVLIFFGQSEEFTNICKSYGIDRGEI
ncbi:MAG: DUF4214 domain-containing protein [Clostridiales bacterium]|nr:DUF4214 domain-containing protein [Clostridiales bacterium]